MTPYPQRSGTAAYRFEDTDRTARVLERLAGGDSDHLDPARYALEERVAALEGGSASLAVASCHAARLIALQVLMQPGDDVVVAQDWGSGALAGRDGSFDSFGWQFKWADPAMPDSFVEALSDRTKAILVASMSPHDGSVVDTESIARVARRARIPLIVDNTLATPYLIHPLEHGADIVLHHTATRLCGFAGTTAAFIVDGGTFDWIDDGRYPAITGPNPFCDGLSISEVVGNFAFALACRYIGTRVLGPAMPAPDPLLVLNGIETLPLRMQRHAQSALAVAAYLERHPAIRSVRYCGLERDPAHELAQRYCPNGAGAIVTFTMAGGPGSNPGFTRRLKLLTPAVEPYGSRSVVLGSSRTDPPARQDEADWIRLAIGLEETDDIIADLSQALAI